MITKYVIIILIFVILVSSCGRNDKNNDFIVGIMGDELEEANSKINTASKDLYMKLASKLQDVLTVEKAKIYNSKALLIKAETEDICNYLDSIKGINKIDWSKINIRLKRCKKIFINADDEVRYGFFNDVKKIPFTLDSLYPENGYNKFLENLNITSRNALLSQFKNSIKNLEYDILKHFDEITTPSCNLAKFDYYSTLCSQNTKHLKNGEVLEVFTGVLIYSRNIKAKITINNKLIEVNNGYGSKRITVKGKPGLYKVPIRIEYIDENSKVQIRTENIEYTIDQ